MKIRPFQASDAQALADLYHAAVHRIGIRHYSAEQVAVWSPAPRPAMRYVEQAQGRVFLVAVDGTGQPIGYADLEPDGHIDHLYCSPDHVGTGVASALYEALELSARRSRIARLFVEASEAARPLFAHKGFRLEHRRNFQIDGVDIHNFRMTKDLGA